MQIEPSAKAFAARYAAGEPQVVWTTLVADLETPVSAFLKIAGARSKGSMSFLLESVEGGAVRGRYSIIGLEPDIVFRVGDRRAEINRAPQNNLEAFTAAAAPPLAALRALIAESRIVLPDTLPPMSAGIFGYLGYGPAHRRHLIGARPRSAWHPRRDPCSTDPRRCLRCGARHDHCRDPRAAASRRNGGRGVRGRGGAPFGDRPGA